MIATAETVKSARRMDANVTPHASRFHRTKRPDTAAELGLLWGCSRRTVEDLLSGERSIFRRVADALAVAIAAGQTERVGLWLDIIEAPLYGTGTLPYCEARLAAGVTDAAEDLAEVEYERNPCEETARALIKRSAHDRLKAEQRERSLKAQWGL